MGNSNFISANRRAQVALNIFDKITKGEEFSDAMLFALSHKTFMLPDGQEGSLFMYALAMNEFVPALYLLENGHVFDEREDIIKALKESLSNIEEKDISRLDENNEIENSIKQRYLKNVEAREVLAERYPARV